MRHSFALPERGRTASSQGARMKSCRMQDAYGLVVVLVTNTERFALQPGTRRRTQSAVHYCQRRVPHSPRQRQSEPVRCKVPSVYESTDGFAFSPLTSSSFDLSCRIPPTPHQSTHQSTHQQYPVSLRVGAASVPSQPVYARKSVKDIGLVVLFG